MRRLYFKIVLIGLSAVLLLWPCFSEKNLSAKKTIVLADISNEPIKKIERYQMLADYLALNLKKFGIEHGEVKITRDLDTLINLINKGEVDIYFDSFYPIIQIINSTNTVPLVRQWKNEVENYYSIFFTMADLKIKNLENLKGKVIALENNYSTSGYFLPMFYMLSKGLKPVNVPSPDAPVDLNKIGYCFAEEDDNIIQWVIRGKVKAGVIDNTCFYGIPETTRKSLLIIAQTQPITRQVVIIRRDLDSKLIDAIKQILIDMEKTETGREILNNLKETKRFEDFPENFPEELQNMKNQLQIVNYYNKK